MLFLAYLGGAWLAQMLAIVPDSGISLWPPAGFFLASFLVSHRPSWPWLTMAALGADLLANRLWFHNSPSVALSLFAANLAGALCGALLIRRQGPVLPFENLRQAGRLAFLGAGIGQAVSAILGSATLANAGIQPFFSALPLWWLGDMTGVLIFAPMVLLLHPTGLSFRRLLPAALWSETALTLLALLASESLFLSGVVPFAYIVAPVFLWAAIRFRLPGVAISQGLFVLFLAAASALDYRILPTDSADRMRAAVELQLFLAVSCLTGLAVAAATNGQARAISRLKRMNE
ncbi:MAG: MASE1 domain-containing protein, partial [Rhodobacteraceae bacterium]|nr:MASE1 domain-containing protein [Paracoccaceae bacterium]